MALIDNISSYWKLEESSGTRVDAAGSNDLTDNNTVTSGTGIIDTGADFEKTNSEYLSIAHASQSGLNPTGDFSINVWAKAEAFQDGNWHGLVSKADNSSRSYMTGILRDGSNYTLSFRIGTTGSSTYNQDVAITPSAGTWYMFTFTFTDGEMKVYQNASLLDTDTGGPSSVQAGTAEFRIGWFNNPGSEGFDGILDEVGFWDGKTLSPTEITELYNGGSGLQYPFSAQNTSNFFMFM